MAIKTVKATINGQSYDLTYNSGSQKWEATITAPAKSSYTQSGHYYGVTVEATDNHGNITRKDHTDGSLGDSLKLTVKEKVAPVITIMAPSAGAFVVTNKPEIQFNITDNDSGVNPDTIKITVDSSVITGGIAKNPAGNGFTCTYTPTEPLGDGPHVIKIDADDFDGNHAVQKAVNFTIDTVPPALNITSPTDNLMTNKTAGVVSGTTNDVTSSPVTIKISLNGSDQGTVTVGSNGAFSKEVVYAVGRNTIIVTATDSAGKTSTAQRTVDVSTTAPKFTAVELIPNPVDAGKTYIIKVSVE